MFTGLVEALVHVTRFEREAEGARLTLAWPEQAADIQVGDSVCINGCCLTVVEVSGESLAFQLGPETLTRTTFGDCRAGHSVNVERALQPGDRLGGHLVTGHIDGVGELLKREDEGDWSLFWFRVPSSLGPQLASKGSVAVDGVSLTLVDVEEDRFSVALIPHTLNVTNLGQLQAGSRANIETDLLAKYVERQLAARFSQDHTFEAADQPGIPRPPADAS